MGCNRMQQEAMDIQQDAIGCNGMQQDAIRILWEYTDCKEKKGYYKQQKQQIYRFQQQKPTYI